MFVCLKLKGFRNTALLRFWISGNRLSLRLLIQRARIPLFATSRQLHFPFLESAISWELALPLTWPLASYQASLCLSLLTCNMGVRTASTSYRDSLLQSHLKFSSKIQVSGPQLRHTESASLDLGPWMCIFDSSPTEHFGPVQSENPCLKCVMSPSSHDISTCI